MLGVALCLQKHMRALCVLCVCVFLCVEFDRLYQILGATIQERGESFYNKLMPEMVQELERKSE